MFRPWEVPSERWDLVGEGVRFLPILGLVVGFEAPSGEVLVVSGWIGLDLQRWWLVGPCFGWPTLHQP